MTHFCVTAYRTSIGSAAAAATAISNGQLPWYTSCNWARPTSTTCRSGERMMTSGHRKLRHCSAKTRTANVASAGRRSEEHTSELQSQSNLVCRLLLEKKKSILPPFGLHVGRLHGYAIAIDMD